MSAHSDQQSPRDDQAGGSSHGLTPRKVTLWKPLMWVLLAVLLVLLAEKIGLFGA